MAFMDEEKRRCSGWLTSFALRLAKQLADEEGDAARDKNLVFSPLSVYAALGVVAAGARGAALDELLALLVGGAASRDELAGFVRGVVEHALADRSGSGGPLVSFASSVWYDADTVALKPKFLAAAAGSYKTQAHAADFTERGEAEAREEINRWASQQATRGLIADVVPPGAGAHDLTCLVLVNAIYFKGKWERPFAERRTNVDKFFLLGGGAVDTPLMRGIGTHLIAVHDGFKVLKLPYKAPVAERCRRRGPDVVEYSMCVFLPDARDGLWSLVDDIASIPSFIRIHLPKTEGRRRGFPAAKVQDVLLRRAHRRPP